jgi:hypothetical protein
MANDTWNGNSDSWGVAADWSGGVPTSSSNVIISSGNPQITTIVGTVASVNVSSQLTFTGAGNLIVSGAFTNSGSVWLDPSSNAGGAALTVSGTLTNSGYIQIGPNNNTLSSGVTVSAASVTNFISTTLGTIDIFGNTGTPALAKLAVSSSAGLGAAGVLEGNVNMNWDALLQFASGQITTIAGGSSLTIDGTQAFVADAGSTTSNSALTGLTTINGGLYLGYGASVTTSAGLTNTGTIALDQPSSAGGSSLTVGGTLTNDGFIQIGANNNTLTAPTTVTATSLTNFISTTLGTIDIFGNNSASSPKLAKLSIASAAGAGATGVLLGNVTLNYDALLQFASGQITTIAGNSSLSIDGTEAFVADVGSTTSNSALTGLTTITGGLYLNYGASVTTSAGLTNTGTLGLDQPSGAGGSSLTVGGVLTNSGFIQIGPSNNTLAAATTVTATSLTNFVSTTLGAIDIFGNNSASSPELAKLNIASAAGFGSTGVLLGNVTLNYDALLQFASGQITTIAGNSSLTIDGTEAFVADAGSTTSNSALTGLATINGGFYLDYGASLTTSAGLTNKGTLELDHPSGAGGSTLTLSGALTNSGFVQIGPNNNTLAAVTTLTATSLINNVGATLGTIDIFGDDSSSVPVPIRATLNVTSAAGFGSTGVLQGNVTLNYDALLQFASGQITTIAANSSLTIDGTQAFVADAGSTTSNSALTGLTTITGGLYLGYGAAVTTSAGLTNTGTIALDQPSSAGGSSLTVGGALTNSGFIQIGPNNNTLAAATTLTATSLVNNVGTTLGTIDIFGNDSSSVPVPIPATLNITGAAGFGAGGVLEGNVNLNYDALLEFQGGGQITTIAANSNLAIWGTEAFVADASNTTSNSALTGLTTITGGLYLAYGASVTTTAGLTVASTGTVALDQPSSAGGSSLTLGGVLTNGGFVQVGPNNSTLSANTTLSATGLINTGTIALYGSNLYIADLAVSGATSNAGAVTIGAGAKLDSSAYTQTAGTTYIYGALNAPVTLDGGTIVIESGGAINGAVNFGGAGTLSLSAPPTSPIGNFQVGDSLDLTNVAYAAGEQMVWQSTAGGAQTYALEDASNNVLETLSFSSHLSAALLQVQNDGSGHASISLNAPPQAARSDYTDGNISDLVWQNQSSGVVYEWEMANGQNNSSVGLGNTSGWTDLGSGHFNGAGAASDLLWQSQTNGDVYEWTMAGGQHTGNIYLGNLNGWNEIGVGDFAGNGTDDLLWQSQSTGAVYEWTMSNGQQNGSVYLGNLSGWSEAGVGDFYGNGTSDVLWQNQSTGEVYEWQMSNGQHSGNDVDLGNLSGWSEIGTGDFFGNGTDGVLWQSQTTGGVYEWTMSNGQHTGNIYLGDLSGWSLVGTGDYTGNGVSDLIWQSQSTGGTYEWTMSNGQHTANIYLGGLAGWSGR